MEEKNIVIVDSKKEGSSKERRRERARQRQELAATKKKAEQALKTLETKIEKLEFERAEKVELLAGDGNVDFAEVNRHLARLQSELDSCSAEWEKAMEDFEEIMELNDAINA